MNSYPAVSAQQPRLDFSYYEYPDISRFEEVCLSSTPSLTASKYLSDWRARSAPTWVGNQGRSEASMCSGGKAAIAD